MRSLVLLITLFSVVASAEEYRLKTDIFSPSRQLLNPLVDQVSSSKQSLVTGDKASHLPKVSGIFILNDLSQVTLALPSGSGVFSKGEIFQVGKRGWKIVEIYLYHIVAIAMDNGEKVKLKFEPKIHKLAESTVDRSGFNGDKVESFEPKASLSGFGQELLAK